MTSPSNRVRGLHGPTRALALLLTAGCLAVPATNPYDPQNWGGTFYGFSSEGYVMNIDAVTGLGAARWDYDVGLWGATASPLAPQSP